MKKKVFFMQKECLTLRFEGADSIDLTTLSDSLNATIEVLKKLSDSFVSEDDFCKFKVKDVRKGSFELDIIQLLEVAPTLFPYIPSVLSGFKEILNIRKFLQGELPNNVKKDGNEVHIESNNGNVYTVNQAVFNVYATEGSIEKQLAKLSKGTLEDGDRTGITFDFELSDGKESVTFDKQELSKLSTPMDVSKIDNTIEENVMNTSVQIIKPDFAGPRWIVKLNEKKITINMLDSSFLEQVKKGDVDFHAGSKIKGDVLVRYKDDKVISYDMIKVEDWK